MWDVGEVEEWEEGEEEDEGAAVAGDRPLTGEAADVMQRTLQMQS